MRRSGRDRRTHRSGRPGRASRRPLPRDDRRELLLLSYEVVFDALHDPFDADLRAAMPPAEQERLFDQIRRAPVEAVKGLNAARERIPNSPVLLNWLVSAHTGAGNQEEARRLARLNYERHPDYLFARINHAHFLLRDDEIEQFERLFDGKYDLKLLYPHRDVFHVSEFVGLSSLVIEYLIRKKDLDAAEKLYDLMAKVAPDAELTKQMHDLLMNALLLRLTQRMMERLRKPRKPRKSRTSQPPPTTTTPPPVA